jgi:hypothetical protein|tara:strand:- start:3755 stop:4222 length:468 start_codon:yes stop_codon:yes gene_type:complete
MGNWLFLMLLYAFFGWMKKKQRDKSGEKTKDAYSKKSDSIVEFGEGILNSLIGDDKIPVQEDNSLSSQIGLEENDQVLDKYLNEEEVFKEKKVEIPTEQLKIKKNIWSSTTRVKKSPKNNGNILAGLIDLNDPVKTGVIFKEIFDKPKALRRDTK